VLTKSIPLTVESILVKSIDADLVVVEVEQDANKITSRGSVNL
jgi:hypothetical protein